MLKIVKRLLNLSGKYKSRLITAIVFSFIEGIFVASPVLLVMFTIYRIVEGNLVRSDVTLITILLVLGVLLRAIFRRIVDGLQSGAGYMIFADERMALGEHLKRLPMGYYKEGAMGNVTSIVTSDIVFAESFGMRNLSTIVCGFVDMILGIAFMLFLDYRIAIVVIITYLIGLKLLSRIDTSTTSLSEQRQKGIAQFVSSIIEFVTGISVIKAFNMKKEKKVSEGIKVVRNDAIDFETQFAKKFIQFNYCFAIGIGLLVIVIAVLNINQSLTDSFAIIMWIYAYQIFISFKALAASSALTRIMEAGLNRYEEFMKIPVMDEDGVDVTLDHFDIEFKDVTFAYEEESVLKEVSFTAKQNSMTALVGKSGCGKTTITNLIARFWDVPQGEVLVGGRNVKDMKLESLLKHISMVFQNVYLFNDTIINNIKFGKPDATMEEVIEAAKKARCYDFIMSLEDGFETVLDESGASLSGGEKQRISIARAILKDAPIILLDEATASVDPDNEAYIQSAIDALIKDKTLIVIAHKLATIKNADQIIVLDKGEIINTGTHQKLIEDSGIYSELWNKRTKARSWKIQK